MLNLAALYHDLQTLAARAVTEQADRAARRQGAVDAWHVAAANPEVWRQRARDAKTTWLIADLHEPPGRTYAVATAPAGYTVVAADGSQIFPDRHGPADGYLINLGQVVLRYGDDPAARLQSEPHLIFDEADLYHGEAGDRRAARAEDVGIHRAVMELEALLALAAEVPDRPLVAMADGTLIPWAMLGDDDPWRLAMLQRYAAALAGFRELAVPLCGYTSRSGASEVVALLRTALCDQRTVACRSCPHLSALGPTPRLQELVLLPCGEPLGLCDADLFGQLVRPGQRSPLFASRSRAWEPIGDGLLFCYLAVGGELARVELPAWVAGDEPLREVVLAVAADQAAKGQGYPVALTESHEQAVVRAADRAAFGQLLEQALVKAGATVRESRKSRAKQRPGV